ncbi:T6SS effector amidase Tae4 family protein [Bacteroides faecium]|uniref:Uncharacterized protein n=1 Tax=Bacteroides faecium TaxID=2715212 RepID=A0A6H0KMJ4_9BACE|nr:T6SS effector amidase Tae4 family protein [Bacteroides faecium]QIU94580.1 hypothetical protein BacF7301_10700 [Bacteroides faecium]
MRKIKGNRLMFIILAVLCLCIYACYDGVDFPSGKSSRSGKSKKKNKELTTVIARQWFEANMTPVVTMRSSEAKDVQAAMVKPKWEDAYEANRGKYEVVQTPILTRGRRMFVDAETQSEFEKIRGQKYLRNAARMVIRKDLKTGEIRSFITVFVGSLEYMKKSKKMGRNSYLYREPDFDGKVLFFEPNGGLINGWKYRNGKIVAKIMPLSEDAKFLITRGWVTECYTETVLEYSQECYEEGFGYEDEEWGVGGGVDYICNDVWTPVEYQVCEEEWEEDEDSGDSGIGDGDDIGGDVDPSIVPQIDLPPFSTVDIKFGVVAKMEAPKVYELIGGKVYQNYLSNPAYVNACTLRLSYALNMCGGSHRIPYSSGKTGSGDADRDGSREWYYYKVVDMIDYLDQKYGIHEVVTVDEIQDKKGIVGQVDCEGWGGGGHVDIWDDANTVSADRLYPECETLYFWEFK